MKFFPALLLLIFMSGCAVNNQPYYVNNIQKLTGSLAKKRQEYERNRVVIPIYKQNF